MSTSVCCICWCVGTGALVYCCLRIQEQMVCSERYAQPQPESSNLSCEDDSEGLSIHFLLPLMKHHDATRLSAGRA